MKVAFIGAGRHARTSLYPALVPAGLELVATCAQHREHAEDAARTFGAQHAYGDVDELLATGGFDAVLIAVPPAAYAPLVARCINSGCPVFLEKPGASSPEEARTLAAQARAAGVPVMVGYMKRFAPAYRRAREIMQSEEFGPPSLASFTFVMGRWGDLAAYLIDNPVHVLDLARYLLGELSDLDGALATQPTGWGLAVTARAESGAVATFQLCTTASWMQHNERVEVFGAGHSLEVDNVDTLIHRPPEQPARVWRPNYTVPLPANFTGTTMGFVPALAHFRDVVINGAQCESDLASAAATLDLAYELCRVAGVSPQ